MLKWGSVRSFFLIHLTALDIGLWVLFILSLVDDVHDSDGWIIFRWGSAVLGVLTLVSLVLLLLYPGPRSQYCVVIILCVVSCFYAFLLQRTHSGLVDTLAIHPLVILLIIGGNNIPFFALAACFAVYFLFLKIAMSLPDLELGLPPTGVSSTWSVITNLVFFVIGPVSIVILMYLWRRQAQVDTDTCIQQLEVLAAKLKDMDFEVDDSFGANKTSQCGKLEAPMKRIFEVLHNIRPFLPDTMFARKNPQSVSQELLPIVPPMSNNTLHSSHRNSKSSSINNGHSRATHTHPTNVIVPTKGVAMLERDVTLMHVILPNSHILLGNEEETERRFQTFLTVIINAVHDNSGTIHSFGAGFVTATWNAVSDHPCHQLQACHCAMAIIHHARALPDLQLPYIGISSGNTLVGNVGSPAMLAFSVVGIVAKECVTLAELNEQLRTHVLITEAVQGLVADLVVARMVDVLAQVLPQGTHVNYTDDTVTYQVYTLESVNDTEESKQPLQCHYGEFNHGFALFRTGNLEMALSHFKKSVANGEASSSSPDPCTGRFIAICETYIAKKDSEFPSPYRRTLLPPWMVLQGEESGSVNVRESLSIFRTVPTNKQLFPFDGGHNLPEEILDTSIHPHHNSPPHPHTTTTHTHNNTSSDSQNPKKRASIGPTTTHRHASVDLVPNNAFTATGPQYSTFSPTGSNIIMANNAVANEVTSFRDRSMSQSSEASSVTTPDTGPAIRSRQGSLLRQAHENSSFTAKPGRSPTPTASSPGAGSTSGSVFNQSGGLGLSLWRDPLAMSRARSDSVASVTNFAQRAKHFNLRKVVLTGGPCAGKSTALSVIGDKLTKQGVSVFSVPEAATLLISGGLRFENMTAHKAVVFQSALLRTQLMLEDVFEQISSVNDNQSLILCDRGTMDGRIYCSEEDWEAIQQNVNMTTETLRDVRYDAVFHLVTAADGAEQYYTCDNNAARTETPEQARDLDKKLKQAYVGHPKVVVIDNATNFEEKITKVVTGICGMFGLPGGKNCHKLFLLAKETPIIPTSYHTEEVENYITILRNSKEKSEKRVVKRGKNNHWYFCFQKVTRTQHQSATVENKLSGREYSSLLGQADPDLHPIHYTVNSFMHANHYFEIRTFQKPKMWQNRMFLHVDVETSDTTVLIPPFIDVIREVSNEPGYSLLEIAKGTAVTHAATLWKSKSFMRKPGTFGKPTRRTPPNDLLTTGDIQNTTVPQSVSATFVVNDTTGASSPRSNTTSEF